MNCLGYNIFDKREGNICVNLVLFIEVPLKGQHIITTRKRYA